MDNSKIKKIKYTFSVAFALGFLCFFALRSYALNGNCFYSYNNRFKASSITGSFFDYSVNLRDSVILDSNSSLYDRVGCNLFVNTDDNYADFVDYLIRSTYVTCYIKDLLPNRPDVLDIDSYRDYYYTIDVMNNSFLTITMFDSSVRNNMFSYYSNLTCGFDGATFYRINNVAERYINTSNLDSDAFIIRFNISVPRNSFIYDGLGSQYSSLSDMTNLFNIYHSDGSVNKAEFTLGVLSGLIPGVSVVGVDSWLIEDSTTTGFDFAFPIFNISNIDIYAYGSAYKNTTSGSITIPSFINLIARDSYHFSLAYSDSPVITDDLAVASGIWSRSDYKDESWQTGYGGGNGGIYRDYFMIYGASGWLKLTPWTVRDNFNVSDFPTYGSIGTVGGVDLEIPFPDIPDIPDNPDNPDNPSSGSIIQNNDNNQTNNNNQSVIIESDKLEISGSGAQHLQVNLENGFGLLGDNGFLAYFGSLWGGLPSVVVSLLIFSVSTILTSCIVRAILKR